MPQSEDGQERRSPHHYVLAHVALRSVCEQNPLGFFAIMASEGRQEFLDAIWRDVCTQCDPQGEATFSPSDLAIESRLIGGYPGVLVRMPPPVEMTEAHLIAIVLLVDTEAATAPEDPKCGYYTLELGMDMADESERTVLCAWQDGSHLNFGDGPPAEPDAFVAAVEERLTA